LSTRLIDLVPFIEHKSNMKKQIQRELQLLERQHNISILYAVESGSRAWGFASTNSDWDVRFIYVHKIDWYLSIDSGRDSLEVMLPDELDFAGWELKKTLQLFRKSNPSLLEWLHSPIVYQQKGSLVPQLKSIIQSQFNPASCFHHYVHMAEGNFKEFLTLDQVKYKKYLYVLRPILACLWIIKYNTMPPLEFSVLVNNLVQDELVLIEIAKLIERKTSSTELSFGPKNRTLNQYIDEQLLYIREYLHDLDVTHMMSSDELNTLFRDILNEVESYTT
jgi:uncharacterized protein